MPKSVAFYTLGCKLNFSETSSIQRKLLNSGFEKVDFNEGADVYVINTCSVTDHADKKCKRVVKEALSHNPSAYIAVVGCYAQLKPEEIASIPGVDVVLGAAEKFNIEHHLNDLVKREKGAVYSCDINDVNDFTPAYSFGDRTRTFLKVQDGCDYSCSYCTIPLARGKSRSARIDEVVKQAEEIALQGVKEIVLTGVNTGDFGNYNNESFLDLIMALDEIEGISRFRISSIEPNLLTDEIIEFVARSKRFVPHFHIPLQSGSDKILKLMRRRYLRDLYTNRVARIREVMPHCCIGVDVIVGFPGETPEDFMDSYNFIAGLDVSYLHVFTYSERPNTLAAEMPGRVLDRHRFERNAMLRILSDKKKRAFYEQHLESAQQVLWEADYENGVMHGFTPNYIKVRTSFNEERINTLSDFLLSELNDDLTVSVQAVEEIVA
jgi:threonylcarbamoyladenosine tRNA methylthiotransferase MtaB